MTAAIGKVGERKTLWIRGDKSRYNTGLYIVRRTIPLACLVEVGSLHADLNKSDGLELLKSEVGQNEIAKHIAEALLVFSGNDTKVFAPKPQKSEKNDVLAKKLKEIEDLQSRAWAEMESLEKITVEKSQKIKILLSQSAEKSRLLQEILK